MSKDAVLLDLGDEIALQIAPLRLLSNHIDALTEEAGQRGGKYRTIELSYDQLLNIGQTLTVALDNAERVLRKDYRG